MVFKQFYVAATGMDALEKDLITITDNMSNVKTTGFKKTRVEFETLFPDVLKEAVVDLENNVEEQSLEFGSGVKVQGTPKQFTQGTIEVTNNDLDIAIQGKGLFRFSLPNGTEAYSRAGNLHKDSRGRLINGDGYYLEPAITIPENVTNILVTTDGKVYVQEEGQTENRQVGSIELVKFIDPAALKSIGGNLYVGTAASGDPVIGTPGENGFGQVAQYSLESSNVDVIEEMMRMVLTQRAFDVVSKAIQAGEQMLNSAIEVARG